MMNGVRFPELEQRAAENRVFRYALVMVINDLRTPKE